MRPERDSSFQAGGRSPRGRVLVVEDDRELRGALGDLLRHEGYLADEAENGFEALLALRTGEVPDLVLLDLAMPVMTGWELCDALVADPLLARIPVVALTAHEPDGVRAELVLAKPCRPEKLLAAVARFAPRAARR